jgi:hypothetical protein
MLYRETIAVCSQIHTNDINTLREHNVEYSISPTLLSVARVAVSSCF